MKIIHILSDLDVGGMQKFCLDLANYQISRGYDIEIWCLNYNKKKSLSSKLGIDIVDFDAKLKFWNIFLMLRIFFSISKRSKDTKIHTHGIALYFSIVAIVFLRKLKSFHTIHNLCDHEAGVARRFFNKALFTFKLVKPVTISDEVHSSFNNFYKNCKCTLIKNGVPNSRNEASIDLKKELLDNYKISTNTSDNIFLNVGRFDFQKNRKLLFDVFEHFSRNNKSKLLVIGGEKDENNPYYKEIKDHPGIQRGSIVLLGNRSDVNQLYSISKYFILSSRFEGLPLALLEAMREGLICISTPAGGCASVLKEVGFVSKDFNFDELYRSLKMGVNCNIDEVSRKTIEKFNNKYTMDICGEKYHNLYLEGNE